MQVKLNLMDARVLIFGVLLFCLSWSCSSEVIVPGGDCPDAFIPAICACDAIYDPVCGCNAQTFGNACEALCSGIDNYVKGKCP